MERAPHRHAAVAMLSAVQHAVLLLEGPHAHAYIGRVLDAAVEFVKRTAPQIAPDSAPDSARQPEKRGSDGPDGRDSIIARTLYSDPCMALVVLPSLLFGLVQQRSGQQLDAAAGSWWFLYLGGLLLIAELSGRTGVLPGGEGGQLVLTALFALLIFPLAVRSRLPRTSEEAQVAVEFTP